MSSTPKKTFINSLVESHIDPLVYQSVLETYAKETITLLKYGNISITDVPTDKIERVQFTECEISPFRKHEWLCKTSEDPDFTRQSSFNTFANVPISFELVQSLLIQTFSPCENGSRPYPSAGGLYPVEPLVFIFKERLTNEAAIYSGCYHFRPISKQLQLLKKMESDFFVEKLMHGFMQKKHLPAFVIMYVAHIGKSIFKYRYRGYRHAAMEAGAMYQQATIISQKLGLRTNVWSSFSEQQILDVLGLDFGTYMPLTMQFFGYGEKQ